jgi:hypothetical protein
MKNLMLKREILDAVKEGSLPFTLWKMEVSGDTDRHACRGNGRGWDLSRKQYQLPGTKRLTEISEALEQRKRKKTRSVSQPSVAKADD